MRFARWTFLIAGIYGLLALVPMYFMESQVGIDTPPPITHPEYFYGFIGVAVAFQLVFLIISTDPVKYRPLMLASIVEKLSFVIAAAGLLMQSRLGGMIIYGVMIDLVLGILFAVSWWRLGVRDATNNGGRDRI
ncbi:MAG TPA: hypothetical protein VFZ49_08585 [Pyrinomonadaceae bacterium]